MLCFFHFVYRRFARPGLLAPCLALQLSAEGLLNLTVLPGIAWDGQTPLKAGAD